MKRLALPLALLATPAGAQDDPLSSPLAQAFAEVADTENVAETLECAALFRALAAVLDPDTEAGANFTAREGSMASVAAVLWAAADRTEQMTPEDIFAILLPPMTAATDLFLDHMNEVAGNTGTPFDEALLSRVEFCIAIHDALIDGQD